MGISKITVTNLAYAVSSLAAATVKSYPTDIALFGGGSGYRYVNIYNVSLTYLGRAEDLSQGRSNLAATSIGCMEQANSYVLFGGGGINSTYYSTVDAYSASVTRTTALSLSETKSLLAATSIGDYALFGGGVTYQPWPVNADVYSKTVNAYDTSLTRSILTDLSVARVGLAATSIGDYALFGGGGTSYSYGNSTVDVYDRYLTRINTLDLSFNKLYLASTSIDNYALFGGGYDSNGSSNIVNAFDRSLTMTIPSVLSKNRNYLTAASVMNKALFIGGNTSSSSDVFDIYDSSLIRSTSPSDMKYTARNYSAATSIGNYVIFGGGKNYNDTEIKTVEGYHIFPYVTKQIQKIFIQLPD